MSAQIFTLPDVGEGLTEAEIVSWKASEGDEISLNQVVLEIETAKSLVELPSPYAGTLTRILVQPGETVPVGTALYEVVSAESELKPLVGAGPVAEGGSRRRRPGRSAPVNAPDAAETQSAASTPDAATETGAGESAASASRPLAKPPVRKAAKDAGVDLADLPATGQHGEITRRDLEDYLAGRGTAGTGQTGTEQTGLSAGSTPVQSLSDTAVRGFSGGTERIPVRGVRKMTAAAMVDSAFSAPHVSVFKEIDATATMDLVQSLRRRRDFHDVKVTPLLVVAKACIYALERTRSVNASWTEDEILVKNFVNLGIAAATPRGLIVPNIKNAHAMGLRELAVAINELTQTARAGKTTHADTLQGTFTITNIGSLGVDTGTPIINPGEVGILAFGSIRQKPWVVDGELAARWVTTVGGSFDHRVVDGDLAARFIADVASVLEDPLLLLG